MTIVTPANSLERLSGVLPLRYVLTSPLLHHQVVEPDVRERVGTRMIQRQRRRIDAVIVRGGGERRELLEVRLEPAGLPATLTPHSLRHTFASWLVMQERRCGPCRSSRPR